MLQNLRKSFAPYAFTFQDLVKRVMAYAGLALKFANSSLENVLFDVFACNYLFGLLVFEGFEFNKTQVFALFPSPVGFLPHIST